MAEDTREKILRATRTLIDTEGLEAVTLRAVGAEGGLSRGAAYRHFANKDELLATIALENLTMLVDSFRQQIANSQLHPADLLTGLLHQFYTYGVEHQVHYQLMFTTHWEEGKYPLLQQKGKESFDLMHGMIESLLEVNHITASNTTSRAAILFAFIHGIIELHIAGHTEKVKGLDNAKQLIQDFIQLISAK